MLAHGQKMDYNSKEMEQILDEANFSLRQEERITSTNKTQFHTKLKK